MSLMSHADPYLEWKWIPPHELAIVLQLAYKHIENQDKLSHEYSEQSNQAWYMMNAVFKLTGHCWLSQTTYLSVMWEDS